MLKRQSIRTSTIYDYELWVNGILLGLSIIKPVFLPAVILSYVIWAILRVIQKNPVLRTPLDWGIAILVGLSLLSIFISSDKAKTGEHVLRLWSGVILFRILVNWADTKTKVNWLIGGAALVALGLGGFSFFSVDWTSGKLSFLPAAFYDGLQAVVSDAINPNVMAGTFLLFMPIGIAILFWAFSKISSWMRIALVLGLSFLSVVLLLTQSRGALLALMICLLLFVGLRWRWGWLSALFPVIVGVVFWKQRAQYQLLDYMLGTAFGSYESRLEIWGRATYILQDFSFTGIGMGLFGNLVDLIYPLFLVGSGKVVHAHNLFLQIGVDLGLPGLIAWFSIYGAVLAITLNITRVGKQTDDHWLAGLGYGLLGSQLVLGLHGLLDSVTWGVVRSAPLVWALWAIVWVVHHNYCRPADSFPNEAVA